MYVQVYHIYASKKISHHLVGFSAEIFHCLPNGVRGQNHNIHLSPLRPNLKLSLTVMGGRGGVGSFWKRAKSSLTSLHICMQLFA